MMVNNASVALNDLNSDISIVNGVLGVICNEYISQKVVGRSLSGLHISSYRSKEHPIFHSSTNIYGFLNLQDGPHKLSITDPQTFFLPRTVSVIVPEYSNKVLIQRLNSNLKNPQEVKFTTIKMYPSIQYPLLNGETSMWGTVVDAENKPCAFCRMTIETEREGHADKVNTYSDINGVYLLRLTGERTQFLSPDDGDFDDNDGDLVNEVKRKLRVYKLKENPRLQDDPLSVFPVNFDNLPDSDAPESPYKKVRFRQVYPESLNDEITITIGHKNRVDIQITGGF